MNLAPEEERLGFVSAVYGVNASGVGPASGISYDVDFSPGGNAQTAHGVRPQHRRPPDTVDTIAAHVGDIVRCARKGSDWKFAFVEFPDMKVCST